MNDERPNYYAVIPATVRYDKELKANEKLLYGEISALAQKSGYCWASNNYFAELYNVSTVSISNWINHLKERGYIDVKLVYRNGTHEIEKRVIGVKEIFNTSQRNLYEGIKENFNRGIKEIFKENNTSINNININKRESKERKSPRPSLDEIKVYVKENNLKVNPEQFFNYFEAGEWKDAKGQVVRNWKQKILTWNKFESSKETKEEQSDDERYEEVRRKLEREGKL